MSTVVYDFYCYKLLNLVHFLAFPNTIFEAYVADIPKISLYKHYCLKYINISFIFTYDSIAVGTICQLHRLVVYTVKIAVYQYS